MRVIGISKDNFKYRMEQDNNYKVRRPLIVQEPKVDRLGALKYNKINLGE
jgi:hypothetical protein